VRVLICGSRNWTNKAPIFTYLDGLLVSCKKAGGQLVVIEGGAKGADVIAQEWCANQDDIEHLSYAADWSEYGKAAGAIRNEKMLKEGKPDLVMAFKSDFDWFFEAGGTEHMVKIASKAGVPCYVISKNEYTVK
jgi:hypothetical protein